MRAADALARLRMLQLASANLPVGGFTYSQGLEWAVEAGWLHGEAGFRQWLQMQWQETLVRVDWPILIRLYRACARHDADCFGRWSDRLLACRETAELRQEERQRGEALFRVLQGWGLCTDPAWGTMVAATQSGGMAWLGWHWRLPLSMLMLAHGHAWLEGAVMAAVKLVPLGQQAAQTLLADAGPMIAAALPQALMLEDEELGGGVPLVAIASACHETQYTRLFRS